LNADADKLAGDYLVADPAKDCSEVHILPTGGFQLNLAAGTIT